MHISRRINAPRAKIYQALLDPKAIVVWRVPAGMTCHVHYFDAREGGSFRISLTYQEPSQAGKTNAHTDTYHGRFLKLVLNEQVIEVDEFETDDPALQGEMTVATTLVEVSGGTEVTIAYQGLPRGVSIADNETGTRMALANLAALIEARD